MEYISNGYQETIRKGISAVQNFNSKISFGVDTRTDAISKLKLEFQTADAVVIGAGAGLSTAAGYTYSGKRFEKYFYDFGKKYGFKDMYSGGFYPYSSEEEFWAYWSRYIYINRYINAPKPVYNDLYVLVKDKDYFVITTNVDHCFQKAGFDKERLFYTQGDYGLFQSINPDIQQTFDNEDWVIKAIESQGFVKNNDGIYDIPADKTLLMKIPSDLIPKCPVDGSKMTMNLRSDDSFVEDNGWHKASYAYADFLHKHENMHILFLEIGVGSNTPVIIKYPFWQMTNDNPKAIYACLNYDEAYCPKQIEKQSICIDGDSGEVISLLQ